MFSFLFNPTNDLKKQFKTTILNAFKKLYPTYNNFDELSTQPLTFIYFKREDLSSILKTLENTKKDQNNIYNLSLETLFKKSQIPFFFILEDHNFHQDHYSIFINGNAIFAKTDLLRIDDLFILKSASYIYLFTTTKKFKQNFLNVETYNTLSKIRH